MQNDQFDKRMEKWAEQEAETAPGLQPTPEMIQLVGSKKGKYSSGIPFFDWSHAVVALAALIICLITYTSFLKPNLLSNSIPETVLSVAQRAVMLSDASYNTLPARPLGQGKGRGPAPFQQIDFQIYCGATNQIDSLDLRYELLNPLTLTSQDSYRLLLKSQSEQFLYLFLQDPAGEFQALHHQLDSQRLPGQKKVFLPQKPNWFYLLGEHGEYKLYLISTPTKISEFDDLFDQYIGAYYPETLQSARAALQSFILNIETSSPNKNTKLFQLVFHFEE